MACRNRVRAQVNAGADAHCRAGRTHRPQVRPELPLHLAGLFIVFDAEQNHAARIAKAARERWQRYSAAEQATLAGRVTLARVSLGLPLVWRGCAEERLSLRPV